ncbi:hypothetical protein ANCCAN_04274 [Ancylostoma caninum]|uniref:Uncharacterized protein n=1 Tax=Ancylostoma caninum TaxID=29170 RepID=A0A368H2Z4_ANCCA|nr:hypothetical protein ANCCAN_04274 [Ancylostoma caninum]
MSKWRHLRRRAMSLHTSTHWKDVRGICLRLSVHGISVGRRYDPLSLIFSKPCICNEGWKGDLCEYHLTDRMLYVVL